VSRSLTEFTDAALKLLAWVLSIGIGCIYSHTKRTRPISNTPYKLLQFELSSPDSRSGLFLSLCACFYCHLCVLSLYSTQTRLPRFNYFTVVSTPMCVVYLCTIGGRESQGSCCSVQTIAIGYRILQCVAVQSPRVCGACSYIGDWFWLSGGGLTSYVCMYVTYGLTKS